MAADRNRSCRRTASAHEGANHLWKLSAYVSLWLPGVVMNCVGGGASEVSCRRNHTCREERRPPADHRQRRALT